MRIERYRKTMTSEILHSWAKDAQKEIDELRSVAEALREYIDSIPEGIQFEKTMPGVDRDWVDEVLDYKK